MSSAATTEITPRHLWTNGGDEVLVVRFCGEDGSSSSQRLVNGESIETKAPFIHPLEVGKSSIAEDWDERPVCGGGIHGWAWGFCVGEGVDAEWQATWLVYGVKPCDIVAFEGKVKFRTGIVRYVGDWHGANLFILDGQMAYVHYASRGSASNSGDRGSASNSGSRGSASNSGYSGSASNSGSRGSASNSGYSGSASNSGSRGSASNSGSRGSASNSGDRGSASNSGSSGSASNSGSRGSASNSGYRGSASNSGYSGSASNSGYSGSASNSGYSGSASNSGDRGSASNSGYSGSASNSGYSGSASNSGDRGSAETTVNGTAAVCTGLHGRAKAAEFGVIALSWWNEKAERAEMRCSLVGREKDQLKPEIWYTLDDNGEFVEVE